MLSRPTPHPAALPAPLHALDDGLVVRHDLLRALDNGCPALKLIAPPGFGKTTLISQWQHHRLPRSTQVVWYRPSSDDVSAEEFWDGLVDVLRDGDAMPRARRQGLPVLEVEALIGWLCERGTPLVIVLDDHHLVDPSVDRHLVTMAAEVPELRVVFSMRTDRRLWIDATQDRYVHTINGRMLLLRSREITALLRAAGQEVDEAIQRELAEETGGWPGLVHAVLPACGERTHQARRRNALRALGTDYLHHHVLPALSSTADADWLRRVSVSPSFNLRTARHLIGADRVGELLDHGVRTGLVQERPGSDQPEYRLPGALRRQLVEQFNLRDPRGLHRIRRALLRRDVEQGNYADALDTAVAMGDWLSALEVIEAGWMGVIVHRRGRLRQVFAHVSARQLAGFPRAEFVKNLMFGTPPPLDRLRVSVPDPEQIVVLSPEEVERLLDLGTARMIALRLNGRFTEAQLLARRLVQVARGAERSQIMRSRLQKQVLAAAFLYVGMSLIFTGDLAEAEVALISAHDAVDEPGGGFVTSSACCLLAMSCALRGDLPAADFWLTRAAPGHHDADPLPRQAVALAGLLVAVERLDHQGAGFARQALDESLADRGNPLWFVREYALAQWALVWGDREAALSQLAATQRRRPDAQPFARTMVEAAQIDLLLSLGYGNRAATLLRRGDDTNPLHAVASARLAALSGDPSIAFVESSRAPEWAGCWPRAAADLSVIRFQALVQLTEPALAQEALAYWVENYRGTLRATLWLPAELVRNCLGSAAAEVGRALAEQGLLGRCAETIELIQLTGREQVVLGRIAAGLTAEQTAEELFVSINTVKSQLRSVYRKLGVSNRLQAVLRASTLGLLDPSEGQMKSQGEEG